MRPGNISAVRTVPPEIARPPYLPPESVVLDVRSGLPKHPFMYMQEVKTADQVAAMRAAGALAQAALAVARDAVRPGATTDDIDSAVHDFIVTRGAYPSPLGYLGFPKSVSTSVNDVIAHGIPDDRPLVDGDILNVDVTVFLEGHHGDTSSMFVVGTPDESGMRLCKVAQQAMVAGIEVCGPGMDFRDVGTAIEDVAFEHGYYVSEIFLGHGVGSYFHGQPEIYPYKNDHDQGTMLPGMTFTIEPVLVEHGDMSYVQWEDGWTYQTTTNARSAQFEHTILITESGVDVLTGPSVVDFASSE